MRTKKGVITSAKMTGTVAVTVHRHAVHPKYRKRYRISRKYLADPNGNENLREGDEVIIGESRPMSKNKKFKVIEIVKKAAEVSELKEEEGLEKVMHREKKVTENVKKATEATKETEDSPAEES